MFVNRKLKQKSESTIEIGTESGIGRVGGCVAAVSKEMLMPEGVAGTGFKIMLQIECL